MGGVFGRLVGDEEMAREGINERTCGVESEEWECDVSSIPISLTYAPSSYSF